MTAVPTRKANRRGRVSTVVLLVAALAVMVAIEVADLARSLDSAVLNAFIRHRTPSWTSTATALTNTGASPFAYPVAISAAAVVWFRTRQWRPAVAAPIVLILGVLSRLLLSILVRDDRPPVTFWLVPVGGFSFPSGHAAASALLAGTLIWLVGRAGVRRSIRLTLNGLLGAWALLVGLTRLYLGVHWITDIVGSWLLAAAWLNLLPLVDRLDSSIPRAKPSPAGSG